MQVPRASVVVPTYNSGRLVAEAVASILAQTVVPSEIIVVDDGSTDDTRVCLAPYAERIRYVRQENQGVSAARNRGIETARGEFVAFLDADDVWHPRKIELQIQAFERCPRLGLLGTQPFAWPDSTFPIVAEGSVPHTTIVDWSDLAVKNYLTTSSVLVRRALLAKAGSFDRALQYGEDRDLWLRVAEAAPVANLELPLTGYRDVAGSLSKQAQRCEPCMLRLLQKLDERKLWRGRRWLRRKAYGYAYHSCAYVHSAAGGYGRSLACSLKSLAWYPFPYRSGEVKSRGERPVRVLLNALRWLGLRSADAPAAHRQLPQPQGA